MPLSLASLKPTPTANGLVLGYGNTPESLYPSLSRTLNKLITATG